MPAQDWLTRDFYAVLEVPHDSTEDTLKRSYRRLARRHHPDTNVGCRVAEHRFKQINEAYTVLSDQRLRYEYDLSRDRRPAAPARSGDVDADRRPGDAFGGWSAAWCTPAVWTAVVWSTMLRSSAPASLWWPPQREWGARQAG